MANNLFGKTISKRYVIEEMLGQGGMSAVYKGNDPNLKRVVAIKVIHSHLSSNPDFVQRFEEEAAAVAQLRHPGIIQVYDFNRDDDLYYMILEFVPGETIQDHLKRLNDGGRKLSPIKAAEYMAGICDAVDYAHQRGMIHRDIKPANLMLTTTGQVILMDFGIAKIVGGTRHTATGAVVGTAMYMSPEQIKGEQPDRRTDIYSLGVTLFEMVSGRPPFEAESAMTLMMMHINDPVPNPKKLNPDVPDALVAVIQKALAKDPNDRYQTAAQMAAALRNTLSAGTSSPLATMMEDATIMNSSRGTTIEKPYAGTYVESTPIVPARGTMIENSAPSSMYSTPPAAPAPKRKNSLMLPIIAVAGIGLICLAGGAIFVANQLFGNVAPTEIPVVIATNTQLAIVAPLETEVPTETLIPATATPSGTYVVITAIRVEGNLYAVDYDVHNFTDGLHVHIFFNTVPPEQAGSPGSGPWKLTWGAYGNPPFTQYSLAARPANATQMCALVANSNHSVQLNTGNCVDLP
ncbi:MAG: serine/threonine protein kinase [Chloroflexi bacterium]|nr:serine/threonine protein kinase [Chloroflexota bacterium]